MIVKYLLLSAVQLIGGNGTARALFNAIALIGSSVLRCLIASNGIW